MRRLVLLALLVPVAAGCVSPTPRTHKGLLGPTTATVRVYRNVPSPVPRWIEVEHLPKKAIPGAELLFFSGCTACHVYAGSGGSNLGAPALTAIGRRHLGIRFQIAHLKCPHCVNPGSPMPSFASLGKRRLHELAVLLEASKGTHR